MDAGGAQVVPAWEAEADKASCKVAKARFGVVLDSKGGALAKLLPIFQLGGGGVIGSGAQYFSWVSLRDVVGALTFLLDAPLDGPVNVCAPQPVTNAQFTAALGSALGRPTLLPFPEFAARILFGQMGEEMLIGGQRVLPAKLLRAGFQVLPAPQCATASATACATRC